jgi:hypothetical protein
MENHRKRSELLHVLREIIETKKPKPSRDQAVALLWKRGNLSWKLDQLQTELYDFYQNSDHKKTIWVCSL